MANEILYEVEYDAILTQGYLRIFRLIAPEKDPFFPYNMKCIKNSKL